MPRKSRADRNKVRREKKVQGASKFQHCSTSASPPLLSTPGQCRTPTDRPYIDLSREGISYYQRYQQTFLMLVFQGTSILETKSRAFSGCSAHIPRSTRQLAAMSQKARACQPVINKNFATVTGIDGSGLQDG